MKLVTSAADLAEMRSLRRALVFIYVNWAIQARRSEAACRVFLTELHREIQKEEIPIFRVDLSDQEGEVWEGIRKWLKDEAQPYDLLTYGGNGAMLWVRLGTVDAYVPYLAEVERSKLAAITRGAFQLGPVPEDSRSKPLQ